jgi:iron complex outermembrane recepter protein
MSLAERLDECIIKHMLSRRPRFLPITLALTMAGAATPAFAQPTPPTPDDQTLRFRMPTVTVTARKEVEDRQKVPASVTAVSADTIRNAGIRIVSDAAIFAPNTIVTESTARKLSNVRVRGIGSSPNNPAITTVVDGVPQLTANSSSLELLDVDQIEFVRGPQSALFGRNTLGGLVSITSARPSVSEWTASVSAPFGNHGAWGVAGGASGPIAKDKAGVSVAFAQVSRDGFTVNDVSGRSIDDRSAFSAKAQLLWLPARNWETRVIVNGERARDGDYALNDVGALRARPFHAARDFEGFTDRDVLGTTVLARRTSNAIVFESTTGFVDWQTRDVTDLDYLPLPLLTRDNTEEAFQFTQEVRVASADGAQIVLGDSTRLRWQSGVFLFTQSYDQDAINSYAANVIAPFPLTQHTPRATLDDVGVGLFGQATVTFGERLDLTGGARFDYEDKRATLDTFFDQPIAPPATVDADESFSNVSPQVSAAYRIRPDKTLYASIGRGYKAGGFNPVSPLGSEAYGEERTWHVEGGVKTAWANNRFTANAAIFSIDWDDLQLNVPDPFVPAQFYIANVGGARSRGIEMEVAARAAEGLDLVSAFGYTHARFAAGSRSSGADVGGNTIPYTPDYTVSLGAQYQRRIGETSLVGRADVVFYGAFTYDDLNSLEQEAYSLVNLRFGVSRRFLIGEVLVRNAFDTRYIPFAFPYPNLAPSGFLGEMGAPRTVSVRAGVRF